MIRRAVREDLSDIQIILDEIGNDILNTFSKLWQERNYWCSDTPLVYVENEKIIGFVAYKMNYKDTGLTKVYYLAVHPDHQGKKIASKLMKKVPGSVLYVTEENTDGGGFIKKLGFKFIDRKLNEFGTYDDYYVKME